MEILVMVGQLLLGLTILVGVHEWGHMFAAKRFGMRVEKFSIGFPPKIFGKKVGETEYSFGAIPLGGFVKISGMVDESMDKEQLKQPPQPWEFRSKPAWQRLIVMLGGIIVNVITGVLIFIGITAYYGENYIPASNVKNGIYAGKIAREMGLQTGDKIIKVNGKAIEDFDEVYSSKVFLDDNSYYTVERNGQMIDIKIPSDFMDKLPEVEGGLKGFIFPLSKFTVGDIMKSSNAEKGGLMKGDIITKIGNREVLYYSVFQEDKEDFKGKVVPLRILRNGEEKILNVEVAENGLLGFTAELEDMSAKRNYNFFQAIPVGTKRAFSVVFDNVKGLGKIFKGQVSAEKSLQGPIGIAKMFGGEWIWARFWSLIGMLSMVLAFMNLLPIPALDGGHVVFLSAEMISGKKPSDKFLEYAQMAGMIILLLLMVFVFYNDIAKMFK